MAANSTTAGIGRGILPASLRNSSLPAVLVIDDEALIRWALSEALTSAGYRVEVAANGAEARLALGARDHEPCVVVLDLRLPDVRDLSLLADIRSLWPGNPVLVMTAHGTAQDEQEAMRLGAVRFLGKPFDVEDVVRAVGVAWLERAPHPGGDVNR